MRRSPAWAVVMLGLAACGGSGGGAPVDPFVPVVRGPFTAGPVTVTGAGYPGHLAVGYFDADRRIDALESDFGSSSGLAGFLGEDGNSFRPVAPTTFGVPSSTRFLLAGHFDLDAFLDVVAIEPTNGGMVYGTLLGRGDGSFDPAVGQLPWLPVDVTCATIVDANGDLFDDIAFGTFDEKVGFLLSDGAGGFTVGGVVGVLFLGHVLAVTAADLNNDGREDVAALYDTGNVLSVLGDGAGGASTYATLFDVGTLAQNIVVTQLGIFNYLVVAMRGPPVNLRCFNLDNTGGFTMAGAQSVVLSDTVAVQMVPVDSPGGFGTTLAVLTFTHATQNVYSLYLVEVDPSDVVGARAVTVAAGEVVSIAAADANADLHGDLVVLGIGPGLFTTFLQVLLGNGPENA